MATNDARSRRLADFFVKVVKGKRAVTKAGDAVLFLEAICDQKDRTACVERLVASDSAANALQAGLRFNISDAFINGNLQSFLRYLQDPPLKLLCNGEFLRRLLILVVDPPSLWNAFVDAHKKGWLSTDSEHCFAWLLLELLSWNSKAPIDVQAVAQEAVDSASFTKSENHEIRTFGHRIKHVLQAKSVSIPVPMSGPGGRHDNDFVDFRQIAIYPTEDEVISKEKPFYRRADAVDEAKPEQRVAVHFDNQFRLLREDMLAELRDDLKISQSKSGRRRNTRLRGLSLTGFHCGAFRRRSAFSITLRCKSGLERLINLPPAQRKSFLKEERKFLKHQSFGCLMENDKVIAFATLDRVEDLLLENPPVITLRIPEKKALERALLTLKLSKTVDFVLVDTAMFAYEPILGCLQTKLELPLAEELLSLNEEDDGERPRASTICPARVVRDVRDSAGQDLRDVLKLPNPVHLDPSQTSSLLAGLDQAVSLIQGPPGTGKSFIGALLAKAFHDHTSHKILVICYTNHALDQFLEDLLDIGIPNQHMVRMGAKSRPRTENLSLFKQSGGSKRSQATWDVINKLNSEVDSSEDSLKDLVSSYSNFNVKRSELMEYLEFSDDDSSFFEAFQVPDQGDNFTMVGAGGRNVDEGYLFDRWSNGHDAGVFKNLIPLVYPDIWNMGPKKRFAKVKQWTQHLLEERVAAISSLVEAYDASQKQLRVTFDQQKTEVLRQKRIIACTTTAAAMYTQQLQSASPDIILVEEAGEILESHVLTAMTPQTKQLILIGDHQQLRPKVNNYALTVEKGNGYDLNRSLFERLILAGFPHTTLAQQHRMCPEISALIRHLTYPGLSDAPKTKNRAALRGVQDRVVFFNHQYAEFVEDAIAERRDQGSGVSKKNTYEADIVLQVVRYLAQQGYGTSDQVVLTPYLGQLSLLRRRLSEENDPVLNDLDSFDLVKAGLLSPISANHNKRQIKISTIDNYQGEESDIVIASLTRSNTAGDIGFMSSPERLNVLLSRARIGLIIIGNSETFLQSRKGKETWSPLFDFLSKHGHIYEGLPVRCQQHPDKTALLKHKADFDEHCPDGGCSEPCGAKLKCDIHICPRKCHQLSDHSKVKCQQVMSDTCPEKHKMSWRCFAGRPTSCKLCEADAEERDRKAQRDIELEEKRQKKQREYAQELAELQDEIAHERRLRRENSEQAERDRVLRQQRKDLEDIRRSVGSMNIGGQIAPQASPRANKPQPHPSSATKQTPDTSASHMQTPSPDTSTSHSQTPSPYTPTSQPQTPASPTHDHRQKGKGRWKVPESPARDEWKYQKKFEGARNKALDQLMDMVGLENVKEEFLDIKAKVEVAIRQNVDMKHERFGTALLGNPGTGKTTVARLYAEFLASVGALPGSFFLETTGSRLASDGVKECEKQIEEILKNGGGAMFIDEAYQLASGNSPGGRQVLDFLLAEVENLTGKVVFILAGYNKQMEAFFAHNPGIPSRFPREIQFKDYENEELLEIFKYGLNKRYKGQMKLELGTDGLYARIVARRIGRGRDHEGFGNARSVENVIARITERQAKRLRRERRAGKAPDDHLLTLPDLLGPEPKDALKNNASWTKLQELIGLTTVKDSVKALFDTIQYNYTRELDEEPLIEFSLNKVFLGNPGTGKTTVAKLYGQVLADLGFLTSGEVVIKTPADFISDVIGGSEKQTKGILAATLGKVLVIDEAYSLYDASAKGSNANMFKTSVIDTIVAEVQSVPGDDRCVLLLGYQDQMEIMFQNVNPGLTRRFPLDSAFTFEDFTDAELDAIFELKLRLQGFKTTKEAKTVALEMLARSRNRRHFGNAGEIDILFNKAKLRHQQRISKGKGPIHAIFEAPDFDPDFDRGQRANTNVDKLFEGVVGCEDIVTQLQGYQNAVANMKALDMDPYEHLPFSFLFRGPPGTGKTSTARRMGKIYYDMGFLATAEVLECSASDLVGQYIGHTGPKTKALFDKALGKVLFIDEAYRLADGHFAKEAMDEITDCMTKPAYANKLVIILAGYDADINRLMTTNPGLTSRFAETMSFRPLTAPESLALLTTTLHKSAKNKSGERKIDLAVLDPPTQNLNAYLLASFDALKHLPGSANARDVKLLAKNILAAVMRAASPPPGQPRAVPEACVVDEMDRLLQERRLRAQTGAGTRRGTFMPGAQPPPVASQTPASGPPPNTAAGAGGARGQGKSSSPPPPPPPAEGAKKPPEQRARSPGSSGSTQQRDAGVSDDVWEQLQRDTAAAEAKEREYRALVAREDEVRKQIEAAEEAERKRASDAQEAERRRMEMVEEKRKHDELMEEKRKRDEEEARRRAELERRRKELEELERRRRKVEEERRREVKRQECLRVMGVCPQGFVWRKQGGGYRCAGGSHWVSDAEIAQKMT